MPLPESFVAHLQSVREDLDPVELHKAFVATVGPGHETDADAFLTWLGQEGTLSGEDVATLNARSPVAVGASPAPQPLASPQPDEARYDKLSVIGAGAMGEVHIAKDRRLGRRVAVKEMKARAVKGGHARRFLREVQITSQLEHPQIVPVYDLDLDGDAPAFAMKLVPGRDLSTLITEARALNQSGTAIDNAHSLQSRLEHFLKVCDAVHYAHVKGVVHRDLKPENIRIGRHNEVYVLDWGVSRLMNEPDEPVDLLDEDTGQSTNLATSPAASPAPEERVELLEDALQAQPTRVGAMVGTPAYMAPEQAMGISEVDARADQYSLGLILHEMVTLRPARTREGLHAMVAQAVEGSHQPIEHVVASRAIADDLKAIIGKTLSREPDDRYPSVATLADDLRNWLRGLETAALPDRGMRKVRRWLSQHRRWALGTLVPFALVIPVVVALAITGWSSYTKGQDTVAALSGALRAEITSRIMAELEAFVSVPRQANEAHIARVQLGHLTVDDLRAWRPSLFAETRLWPDLGWTQFGAADGRYVGVEHRSDDSVVFAAADADTDFRSFIWQLSASGDLGEVTEEGPYDPRKRPWYTAAAAAGQPRWSEPYYYFSAPVLAISLSHPYRDEAGRLLGVFASDRTLEDISEFLRSQKVGQTGQTFIIDRRGLIIATSADVPVDRKRLRPDEIADPAVRAAAAHLSERFGDLTAIRGAEQWSFELGDVYYLAEMAPFSDPYGLDWTVVVVIPESDFMSHIDAHARDTVLLGVGVLVLAVLLGLLLSLRVRERAQ